MLQMNVKTIKEKTPNNMNKYGKLQQTNKQSIKELHNYSIIISNEINGKQSCVCRVFCNINERLTSKA
jgi:hypothetical protein